MIFNKLDVWNYFKPHQVGISAYFLLVATGIGLQLLMPWPLKLILDYVLMEKPLPDFVGWMIFLPGGESARALLFWLAIGSFFIYLFSQFIGVVQQYAQTVIGGRITYMFAANLFEHIQHLSLTYHGSSSTGDLIRRVTTDSACVRDLVFDVLLPALTSIVTLFAMFFVMWQMEPVLSLIALLVAVPMGILIRIFGPKMSERSYEQQKLEGQIMSHTEQTLASLPVVQAFTRERTEDIRFKRLSHHTIKAYLHSVSSQLQFNYSIGFSTAIGTAIIMGLGGIFALDGGFTVGSLVVFLAYLGSLYAPLEALAYLSSTYASAAASAQRVYEVMDMHVAVLETREAKRPQNFPSNVKGLIKLENVKFGYLRDSPVIKGIDLEFRPGETVALVGPSGAGKSSLAYLVIRLFDPWSGRVTLDGVDVRALKISDLRSQIAVVLQEPFLLPMTVAQNIAYGRPDASDQQILTAAISAGADGFIQELPDGYKTVIGERGSTLSGGEKQRIAIARAFLIDAPILILDEPTASLDAQTESQLLKVFERLSRGRTTVIIAHRLSTIRNADRIVVLSHGDIVEQGTYKTLLSQNGMFSRLHEIQVGSTTFPRKDVSL